MPRVKQSRISVFWKLIMATCGVVVVVVLGLLWIRVRGDTNAAHQKTLQTNLTKALGSADNQAIMTLTTQLISGSQTGRYTVNNKELAEYYFQQGSALMSLSRYNQATQDFQRAA